MLVGNLDFVPVPDDRWRFVVFRETRAVRGDNVAYIHDTVRLIPSYPLFADYLIVAQVVAIRLRHPYG